MGERDENASPVQLLEASGPMVRRVSGLGASKKSGMHDELIA